MPIQSPIGPFSDLPNILIKSSSAPSIPNDIKVKKITKSSDLSEYDEDIKTPDLAASGKIMLKSKLTITIIKIPPPIGVPAFLSWSLSNNGILPFLGASLPRVILSLYKRFIKGTTKILVIRNEKIEVPRASDKNPVLFICKLKYANMCVKIMQNLEYPTDKNFKIIYEFWKDTTNEKNERKTYYKVFGNHHSGIDIGLPVGNKVYAAYSGIVVRKEWHEGMGNVLGIRNGNIVFIYAHLDEILVKTGQKTEAKQIVGKSGKTGKASLNLPHLHFEIRDLTKSELKKMVLKPIFGTPIKNLKEKFIYVVNNTNTPKSLRSLALRYFGNEKYWKEILMANPNLSSNPDSIIPDDTKVIIPNFT